MNFGKIILSFFETIDRLSIVMEKLEIFKNKKEMKSNYRFEYLETDNILELKNICYKYPNTDRLILNNINLNIKNNSINILKGDNGKGKSTLSKIISLMLNPESGEILFNKKYIEDREDIIYYSQESSLFNRTIIENILYPNVKINENNLKEIFEIIKRMGLDNVIKNKKDLIDKNIGEFGKEISGGEKQKILIIRALMSNKKIIIFDEINSQIDMENNCNFYELIYEYLRDRTIIIISHRENKMNIENEILLK